MNRQLRAVTLKLWCALKSPKKPIKNSYSCLPSDLVILEISESAFLTSTGWTDGP